MTVRTFRPRFRVIITKNVLRKDGVSSRYQVAQGDSGGILDITPYLGDGSTISVNKGLYEPMGSFVFTVPDQPFTATEGAQPSDSLYGLVEAMDGVEIYLARSPEQYGWNESAVGQCPVLMRGFIRSVTRTETMDRRGKPRRQVVIQGNDYGALFASFIAVYWWKYRVAGNSWPDEFAWMQAYGEQFVAKPTADFMRIFLKLANDWLGKIYDQGGWTWRIAENFSVTEGTNSPMGLSQNQGPVWAVMRAESDSPFNELWVSDERDAPTLIYRPTPWKTYKPQGRQLVDEYLPQFGQTIEAETLDLDITDIVSIDAERGDGNVANIFWVSNPLAQQGFHSINLLIQGLQASDDTVVDKDYPNNSPEMYGDRLMQIDLRQTPTLIKGAPTGPKKETWKQNDAEHWPQWMKARRTWLRDASRDNSVFEEGSIIVKGDERWKAGMYARITRGALVWECYIVGVQNTFAPFREYTTRLTFIRGTGFWQRTLLERNPAWSEGKKGPYD